MTMDFNGFIEEVSASVRANLKDVNDIQIEEFEKYLKDAIATELVTSARSTITVMGTSDKVTSNLKSALIASTIKKDGKLGKHEMIEEINMDLNRARISEARTYIIESEKDYLDGKEYEKRASMLYSKVKGHRELTDPAELIKVGLATLDRQSCYNGNHTNNDKGYFSFVKDAWEMEQKKYADLGQTDTPYYQIISDIYDNGRMHHFPLATKKALEHIATFTFKLHNNLRVTVSEMEDMNRYNAASKAIGYDVALKYQDKVREVMRNYSAKQKGIAYIRR